MPYGHHAHPRRHRAPPEPRRDGDAETGVDQGELGVVFLGHVGDARLDAFAAQGQHQPVVAELALGPGDPLVVREVLQLHFGAVGERVVGGHRDVGGVVQDRRLGQPFRQRQRLVVPVEDDRDVDVAAHHARHRHVGLHLLQLAPELGVGTAQFGERGGEQAPGGRREGAQQQITDRFAALRLQVGLGQFHLGEDAGGVVGEQPAGVGEAHAAPVLGQELLARLALQLRQLLGDGRGRHVQSVRGAAHRAVAGHGVQRPQAIKVQHISDATR